MRTSSPRRLAAPLFAAAAILGGLAFQCPAATITDLFPAADALIKSGTTDANSNFGTQTTLEIKSSSSPLRKAYLCFHDPAITSPISDARVTLTFSAALAGSRSFQLYALADATPGEDFAETGITWNNAPANNSSDGSFTAAATLLQSVSVAMTATSVVFNDPAIAAFINADTNHVLTFIVYKASNSGLDTIASRENTTVAKPVLEVTTIPEPASLTVLLVALAPLIRRRRAC